jgi:hypothetical protein
MCFACVRLLFTLYRYRLLRAWLKWGVKMRSSAWIDTSKHFAGAVVTGAQCPPGSHPDSGMHLRKQPPSKKVKRARIRHNASESAYIYYMKRCVYLASGLIRLETHSHKAICFCAAEWPLGEEFVLRFWLFHPIQTTKMLHTLYGTRIYQHKSLAKKRHTCLFPFIFLYAKFVWRCAYGLFLKKENLLFWSKSLIKYFS